MSPFFHQARSVLAPYKKGPGATMQGPVHSRGRLARLFAASARLRPSPTRRTLLSPSPRRRPPRPPPPPASHSAAAAMGHNDGEQERDDLSADDSPWSDGVWSEDDEGSLSFEDSGEGSDTESDLTGEEDEAAEESDTSEDEVAPRNTIGDVPLEWYKDEEHIGYDIEGRKIRKRDRQGRIQAFLSNADNAKNWRKIFDDINDEEVQITKEEAKIISRLLKGKTPHSNVDPYPDYVDWFEYEDKGHPLSSAPEPKRRFVPSKWEQKKVVKLVRAIRNGWVKFDKRKEEPKCYLLWGDETDTVDNKRQGLSYIPAPKPNLPGHEESYNPSVEYIPTQEEIDAYQLMYEEDRP